MRCWALCVVLAQVGLLASGVPREVCTYSEMVSVGSGLMSVVCENVVFNGTMNVTEGTHVEISGALSAEDGRRPTLRGGASGEPLFVVRAGSVLRLVSVSIVVAAGSSDGISFEGMVFLADVFGSRRAGPQKGATVSPFKALCPLSVSELPHSQRVHLELSVRVGTPWVLISLVGLERRTLLPTRSIAQRLER